MRRLVVVVLFAGTQAASAEVVVTRDGDRLKLRAVAAPLSEVLDQLAKQTGMKVVYEGAPPRSLVTLTLESRSPVETVTAVLEGQGLNFGMRTDAANIRVDRLMIAGQASAPPAATAAAGDGAKAPVRAVPAPPEFEEADDEPEPPPVVAPPATVGRPRPGPPGAPGPAAQPPAPVTPSLPAPPTYSVSPFAPQPPQFHQPRPQPEAPPAVPAPEPEEETKE